MESSGIWQKGLQMGRTIAGANPILERFLRRQYQNVRAAFQKRQQGRNYVTFWSGRRNNRRIGIYLRGGCDVPAAFACEPFIEPVLNGTCCIYKSGIGASSSHSSLLLQSLEEIPQESFNLALEKLRLKPGYFRPVLFHETFTVPGIHGLEEFPKTVVVLSIGPDFARTLYRHREHGFLVDPGGWWLNQSMDRVLNDMLSVMWFNKNFEKVGRLSAEESMANFTRIIQLVREHTGAYILVFNVLGIEPGDLTHNFQFVGSSNMVRRREFNLALYDLSRQLDFSVVDVDRILKREGVQEQVDFAHWPLERFKPVAQEMFQMMREREIF
ncbi:MAG: hypothetical protein L0332_13370 [Chloroflexi bacterium]|nr:hypothetical protein [Chloroflexota bacterium]MCI0575006.1 hypothetical protein [Chloroflexota bacterium]MCI0645766.1 hypothetical protein [Chloroflexota bacterium]MCI0727693.1 hypothetical protein [Chloroflexota bacterium]